MNHATVISISMYTLDLCTLTSLLLYSRKRIIENNTIGLIQHCVSSRLFQFIVRFCPMYQYVLRGRSQTTLSRIINLRSDTFGNPIFQKGLLNQPGFLPDYKRPGMLCLALPAHRKMRKLDFQSEFSMSKIIRIFLNFFFIEE